jgi:hypothetical protein
MGPGGMPVASSPAPMGEKGHYAYLFPLRPGETQFQVTYSLPYSGSAKFAPKLAGSADNVVVMVPKSMTFTPDPSTPYQTINDDINAQTFVAKNVSATQALGFSVSGSGALPRDVQTAQAANGQPGAAPAAGDNRPGGGLGNPIDTPDPLNKYKWWILSGVGLLLVIAAAFFLRRPAQQAEADTHIASMDQPSEQYAAPLTWTQGDAPPATVAPIPPPRAAEPEPQDHTRSLLNSLKEELFALEADRARGNVGEVEYAAHKQALEAIIRRALNR